VQTIVSRDQQPERRCGVKPDPHQVLQGRDLSAALLMLVYPVAKRAHERSHDLRNYVDAGPDRQKWKRRQHRGVEGALDMTAARSAARRPNSPVCGIMGFVTELNILSVRNFGGCIVLIPTGVAVAQRLRDTPGGAAMH
jgi:hypothetical protein